jgi:hypothetical protein
MFGNINYNINGKVGYELTSEYLTEVERIWFEGLFTSPNVYLWDNELADYIPMNLLTTEYATIPQRNQKLYQVKVELQEATPRPSQNGFTRPRIF